MYVSRRWIAHLVLVCAWGAAPVAAQEVSLEGRVFVRWGDGGVAPRVQATLLTREGELVALHAGSVGVGELAALAAFPRGVEASVTGTLSDEAGRRGLTLRTLDPTAGPRRTSAATQHLTGAQSFVTLLCRFGDQADNTPNDVAFYEGILGSEYPGQDHFWREVSYDQITTPSPVHGWFTLPKTKAEYTNEDGSWNLDLTAQACAALADPTVDFSTIYYINFVVNDDVDEAAWGGGGSVTVEGQTWGFGMTWMPPWAHTHSVFGHEMGHAMGLPHSSGPYAETYDSYWDVLSGGGLCSAPHASYGCVSVHTIAFHKAQLGWIPESRQVTVTAGTQTISLARLAMPASASDPLLVRVPISGSSTDFYAVESRVRVGYDAEIPGEAVVIYRVDMDDRDDRQAQVVDGDGDGDPNDDGAMWTVGETFTDEENQISVTVASPLPGKAGFRVTVMNGEATSLTVITTSLADAEVGKAYSATLQAAGGDGSFVWSIVSGSLPDGLALSANGEITGTPTTVGAASFRVQAESGGAAAVADLTLTVAAAQLTLDASSPPPEGTMAVPYTHQLEASGGDGSYTWSLESGQLPQGLALDESGLISGTPVELGAFAVTVRVTSAGQSATGDLTLDVVAPSLDAAQVLDQLVGTGSSLSSTDLDYLDLLGNGNGSFDLGDYLAWLLATGAAGGGTP